MKGKLAIGSLIAAIGIGGLAGSWATAKTGRSPFGKVDAVAMYVSSDEGAAIGKQVSFLNGFVPVAKKVLPAVVNIASSKTVRSPDQGASSPFFSVSLLPSVFRGPVLATVSDAARAAGAQSWFGRDRQRGRLCADQQSRGFRRRRDQNLAGRQTGIHGACRGHRRQDRRGRGEDRREGSAGLDVGRFLQGAGGRFCAGGGEPVRHWPDGDHGDHQRHGAGRPGNRRLRRLHPDRCRHQPGQLRGSAGRRSRRTGGAEHSHHLRRRRRQPGGRLCGAGQYGKSGNGRDPETRQGAPRVDWRADPAGDAGACQIVRPDRAAAGRAGGQCDARQSSGAGRHQTGRHHS